VSKSRDYVVTAEVTISISTVVHAPSPERAKEIAEDRPMLVLCNQCAGGDERSEWVTSGALDGDPKLLGAELHEVEPDEVDPE
jgi:hypothetical protein